MAKAVEVAVIKLLELTCELVPPRPAAFRFLIGILKSNKSATRLHSMLCATASIRWDKGIRGEVASVIVFLCSVRDSLVSGGHVEVDSGRDI